MSRQTRTRILVTTLATCWAVACPCLADSALPLLSGFDDERMQRVYPPQDDDSAGELAKLVYRLSSVDPSALQARVSDAANAELGDAIAVEGELQEISTLNVPARLVEFLEFSQLQLLVVRAGDAEIRVVTTMLPREAKQGDRVSGVGVVIEVDEAPQDADKRRPTAIATARLRWFPESTESTGWRLLSEAGLDVSLLADVASRTRRPLLAQDGDAFYSMLAAASSVGRRDSAAAPLYVEPVTLLRDTDKLAGEWVRMDLETVQVTRISVTQPHRQAQLGSDHYYQIDAVGDLGNVVIKIERAAGDEGPAVTFENRYPVSVVARELPDFLSERIRVQEGGDAVVSQIKVLVGVDAFFYRLWSYSTVFMDQHGGGEQFGPLLIAATIRSQEPTSSDPAGVSRIGWIAAIAFIAALVAFWFWNRRVAMRDDEVRRRRKMRESEEMQLP